MKPIVSIAIGLLASQTADASNENSNGDEFFQQKQNRRRYEMSEEPYAPYNPLWREEQVYTGERRGPIPKHDRPFSKNRRRRISGKTRPADPRLDPHWLFHDTDDIISATERRTEHYYGDQTPGTFPMQSADIGSGTAVQSTAGYSQNLSGGGFSRRRWKFPIDVQRQNGVLSIGFLQKSFSHNTAASIPTVQRASISTKNLRDSKTPMAATVSATAVQTGSSHLPSRTVRLDLDHTEFSLSLDPFSFASLLRCLFIGGTTIGSVYIGTLQLLGPMIFAQEILRYFLQRDYKKFWRLPWSQSHRKSVTPSISIENSDSYRAMSTFVISRIALRGLLQFLLMAITGEILSWVFNSMRRNDWLYGCFYAIVWITSVSVAGRSYNEWIRGTSRMTETRYRYQWIRSIVAIPSSCPSIIESSHQRTTNHGIPGTMALFSPKHSEERSQKLPFRGGFGASFYEDNKVAQSSLESPLWFPSTWMFLSWWNNIVFGWAICSAFSQSQSHPNQIFRSFVLQDCFETEWHRLFWLEKRILLGAYLSGLGLMATLWSFWTIQQVDRIAGLFFVPILVARLISGWMNLVTLMATES